MTDIDPKLFAKLQRVLAHRKRGIKANSVSDTRDCQLSRAEIEAGLAAGLVAEREKGEWYAWTGPAPEKPPAESIATPESTGKLLPVEKHVFPPGHHLDIHPLCDHFPPMSDLELTELADDIKANKLREPVRLYEGKILDGRNRYAALLSIGADIPYRVFTGTEAEATVYVVSKNIHRRHLKAEKKAELFLTLCPERSDRSIAADAKVDHVTVGKVRAKLERTGDLSPVDKRTGRDCKARKQPTPSPKRKIEDEPVVVAMTAVLEETAARFAGALNQQTLSTELHAVRLVPWDSAANKKAFADANWLRADLQRLAATIDEILETPVMQ